MFIFHERGTKKNSKSTTGIRPMAYQIKVEHQTRGELGKLTMMRSRVRLPDMSFFFPSSISFSFCVFFEKKIYFDNLYIFFQKEKR